MSIEILAPAGAYQSIISAVRCGADAVYFGAKSFSARTAATNLTLDEIELAVQYCRERGVKTYLAINTLLRDSELTDALNVIEHAAELGVDAFILQDMGLAYRLRQACPHIPIHASTQLSIHTLGGVREAAEMGFSRVVLARELSRHEIEKIASESPVELEVFVHGALCMSVSGQCCLSAMLGGRSGNRGACAQPCRLPFSTTDESDKELSHALSLKDLSLLSYINELEEMGIASVKIEGRMKRPEYVAAAVTACRLARDEGKVPRELLDNLRAVFSRSGFTDGYYIGRRGKAMFGTRTKEDVTGATETVLRTLRGMYQAERQSVSLSADFIAKVNQPVTLTLNDLDGNYAYVSSEPPELARNRETIPEDIERQLMKTGGTPYKIDSITIDCDHSLSIPASQLNQLRRQALEKMSQLRRNLPERDFSGIKNSMPVNANAISNAKTQLKIRAVFSDANTISEAFQDTEMVFLPMETDISEFLRIREMGIVVGADIPRGIFGQETLLNKNLIALKKANILHLRVGNIGVLQVAREIGGFHLHAGFGMNLMNASALDWGREAGFEDAEASLETPLRDLSSKYLPIPAGIVGYGHLPLMLLRNSPIESGVLIDRKGNQFSVISRLGCTEMHNPIPLWLADKQGVMGNLGFLILYFTNETSEHAQRILEAYKNHVESSERFTRGLYL